MNVINLNVDLLRTPLKVHLPYKQIPFVDHQGSFLSKHSITTEGFICQQQHNNKSELKLFKQTFKELLLRQSEVKRQEAMKWGLWTKDGYNDGTGKTEGTLPPQSVSI